jgi:hypothetical protein
MEAILKISMFIEKGLSYCFQQFDIGFCVSFTFTPINFLKVFNSFIITLYPSMKMCKEPTVDNVAEEIAR